MSRILPSISKAGIVLPWPTLITYWCVAVSVAVVVGAGSITMDYTAIPADALIATIATIVLVALGVFAVLYLVSYQERKSKVLDLKAQAIKAGTPVDDLAVERVKGFHNIYVAALLLGTAITAAVAYVAMISIVPNQFVLASVLDYAIWGAITTIIAGIVLDRVFIHPIADGTFKKKVLDPAADAIIAQFQADSKDPEAGALSNDQIQAIVNAIAGLAQKKN